MIKQTVLAMAITSLVAGLSVPAKANLVVSGTVNYAGAQRNLIYDTDLDITWLDYSKSEADWSTQMTWAANLSLTVKGVTYDNWRLPATVDGPEVLRYDGTSTAGWNITTSEMGHLFYTELGNKGYYATDGSYPQSGWGLTSLGAFTNLLSAWYWSDTEYAYSQDDAWCFSTSYGNQYVNGRASIRYALAVLPGPVGTASVPEPASILLIGSGLAVLIGLGRKRRG